MLKRIDFYISMLLALIALTASSPVNRHQRQPANIRHNKLNSKREQHNSGPPVYLLISTSSKLYAMRMPELNSNGMPITSGSNVRHYNDHHRNTPSSSYEVIYEERAQANNWITDAFYVRSENLIYVNVYNSTSASSDIFTLRYDPSRGQWLKQMLYEDQAYCLGIAYNEDRRELYWTAAKSIMAGPSVSSAADSSISNNREARTLFNLDLAKKVRYITINSLFKLDMSALISIEKIDHY